MFTALLTGITSLVSGWFEVKRNKQKAEAEYQNRVLTGEIDYDTEALRQKQHSWSDEYLLLLHTFPIWGYALPSEALTARLDILWAKLDAAPSEWWVMYGGMVISTFGLRFLTNHIIKKNK